MRYNIKWKLCHDYLFCKAPPIIVLTIWPSPPPLSPTDTNTLGAVDERESRAVLEEEEVGTEDVEGERRERLLEGTNARDVRALGVITCTGEDWICLVVNKWEVTGSTNWSGGGGGREGFVSMDTLPEVSDEPLSLSLELLELLLEGLITFIFFLPAAGGICVNFFWTTVGGLCLGKDTTSERGGIGLVVLLAGMAGLKVVLLVLLFLVAAAEVRLIPLWVPFRAVPLTLVTASFWTGPLLSTTEERCNVFVLSVPVVDGY